MARDPVTAPVARPPNPRRISGANPGVLDLTQPARLLRFPDARLTFAAFDPLVATVRDIPDIPDIRNLSINQELYRPKRVVVETAPTGESHWRFVPSAHKEDGVSDEGQWPRVVDICGEFVECTQDQWDIYKLDPLYECYVRNAPALSTISRVMPTRDHVSPSPSGKRRMAAAFSPPETTMPNLDQRKKVHLVESSSEDEDSSEDVEVEEVEGMIVDDGFSRRTRNSAGPPGRKKSSHNEKLKKRQDRREKIARRAERLNRQEQPLFDFTREPSTSSPSVPPEPPGKRKVHSLFSSLRPDDDIDQTLYRETVYYAPSSLPTKRTRKLSPTSAKHELETKRSEREKRKKERREKEQNARKEARERRFLSEILADIPEMRAFDDNVADVDISMAEGSEHEYAPPKNNSNSDAENVDPEEVARIAAIEESRRKLAELERDRPLWEEQAKKRAMEEKAEEETLKTKMEARRRVESMKAEAERKAKIHQEQEKARLQEQARRQEEEAARREQEKRRQQQSWSMGKWNSQRALERYRLLCETFDATKFSETVPLTMDDVPWPTLLSPRSFSIEDVDWKSVEKFFADVKGHMRSQDYKHFVQSSHRRFHPDRWRSRSLLKSIVDESERGCIEVAANTVAQALTPLWTEVTGR